MADLNTVYAGTVDVQYPDVVIATLPGFWPWSERTKIYLPDEIRAKIRTTNTEAVNTVQAVKVPYGGTTSADRVEWLNSALAAINNRAAFIQSRTTALLNALRDTGDPAYETVQALVVTGLKLVPVVGQVVSVVASSETAAKGIEAAKLKILLQTYATDLQQLGEIRTQLTAELAKAPNTKDPTKYEAPFVIPTWWYYAGVALLLLLIVWIRRRNRKRSKR